VDVFKIEVFKVVLFIVPGLITLRIKAALSAPSRPLNTVIDGLAFTLVDHALNAFSHYPAVKGAKSLGLVSPASPSLPGELGQAFADEDVLLTRENPIVRVELWNPAPDVSVRTRGERNVSRTDRTNESNRNQARSC